MIRLIKPKYNDLIFRQELLSDPDTMSYNKKYGGTIDFPKEKWENWYDRWIINPNKKFYRYIYDINTDRFVGEVCFQYDNEFDCYVCGMIVKDCYRGLGFGREGLLALLNEANKLCITEVYDNIAIDNSSINLFIKCGFKEEYRNDEFIMMKKVL